MADLIIAAVGKCRDAAILDLIERYRQRLTRPLSIFEVNPSQKKTKEARMAEEAEQLRHALRQCRLVAALDERGRELDSAGFAAWMRGGIEEALLPIGFAIGGAEGLDHNFKNRCAMTLRFGKMTWPHMLARAMLTEQLYRAQTIISGHPYHRS